MEWIPYWVLLSDWQRAKLIFHLEIWLHRDRLGEREHAIHEDQCIVREGRTPRIEGKDGGERGGEGVDCTSGVSDWVADIICLICSEYRMRPLEARRSITSKYLNTNNLLSSLPSPSHHFVYILVIVSLPRTSCGWVCWRRVRLKIRVISIVTQQSHSYPL